jgi:hypothetical protein
MDDDLAKRRRKTPSKECQMETLKAALSLRRGEVRARQEKADAGNTKAKEKAKSALQLINKAITNLHELKAEAELQLQAVDDTYAERAATKNTRDAEYDALVTGKISKLESEPTATPMTTDDETTPLETETETCLEETIRENELIKRQLKQLQEAAFHAKNSPTGQADLTAMLSGNANLPPTATMPESLGDCGKEFAADMIELPMHLPPSAIDVERLTQLHTFFAAAPYHGLVPSITFEELGVPTGFIHGLVGDTIWESCWDTRHKTIPQSNYIPYMLLRIVAHVIGLKTAAHPQGQVSPDATAAGKAIFDTAAAAQTARKAMGSRY